MLSREKLSAEQSLVTIPRESYKRPRIKGGRNFRYKPNLKGIDY